MTEVDVYTELTNLSSTASDVTRLLQTCTNLEFHGECSPRFWSAYIMAILLSINNNNNNILEACHLVRRIRITSSSPSQDSSSLELQGLIKVAQIMESGVLKDIISTIDQVPFQPEFQIVKERLKNLLRELHWKRLANAYNNLQIHHLCNEFVLSLEEVLNECSKRSWKIDNASGLVFPTREHVTTSSGRLGFSNCTEAIEILSKHVSIFEMKSPKIDIMKEIKKDDKSAAVGVGKKIEKK